MLQKLEILETAFDRLDSINKLNFSYENFRKINSEIQNILNEINLNELKAQNDNYNKIFENLLKKIDKLETKILPKANLLEEFSKSKI